MDVAKYAGTFSVRPEIMKGLLIDIFTSLKSWGFRRIFVQNAHGDQLHVEMIRSAIKEVNESNDASDYKVYFMWDLEIEIEEKITFPEMREDRYEPDYHAGAIETAQMATFFPEKVRFDVVKTLKPQNSFHPFAYCGDPASFDKEINIAEFALADASLDALKIEKLIGHYK
jgi:creatinine amidohydrolase